MTFIFKVWNGERKYKCRNGGVTNWGREIGWEKLKENLKRENKDQIEDLDMKTGKNCQDYNWNFSHAPLFTINIYNTEQYSHAFAWPRA